MTIKRALVLRNAVTGAASFSNKGVNQAIASIKAAFPEVVIVERDLTKNQVPMLDEETADAIRNFKLDSDVQKKADALATELIEEIKTADLLIVGLPRYNFGVPTSFKTYLDYVARPKVTFQYGANGPEGLLPNVPVWLVMSAGGAYGEDYYWKWLNTVLPFIGLKNLTPLRIEGVAMGKADESIAALSEAVAEKIKAIQA
eukprot:GILK01014295.1.p1 GENE.GILK01014295.1~~GILK01014295.1.p1  ORF type:complete len:201 (+),score=30.73 GILK01014295.1:42-644(+)